MFEGFDPYHRSWWDSFFGVWIEIRWLVDLGSLGITVDVGKHRQNAGCVIPQHLASGFAHCDQLSEAEGAWIATEDSGQVPDELIHFFASVSGSIESRIFSA